MSATVIDSPQYSLIEDDTRFLFCLFSLYIYFSCTQGLSVL